MFDGRVLVLVAREQNAGCVCVCVFMLGPSEMFRISGFVWRVPAK